MSEKTKQLLASSPRFRGRHHTQETKQKLREALAGRQFSEETRRKISEGVIRAKERRRERLKSLEAAA